MLIKQRLKTIADLVEEDLLIDIGCDHAFLDIYLVQEKGIQAIASDCNKNAYEIAKRNIQKYHLENQIQLYQTDGTKGIPMVEEATLVVAGMGTTTMKKILSEMNVYPNQLILQSNNDLKELRKYVVSLGYYIDHEVVIIEGKIYNVILSCKKGICEYDDIDYEFGPIIRKCINEESKQYLHYLQTQYEKILPTLPKELKQEYEEKINIIKNELKNSL